MASKASPDLQRQQILVQSGSGQHINLPQAQLRQMNSTITQFQSPQAKAKVGSMTRANFYTGGNIEQHIQQAAQELSPGQTLIIKSPNFSTAKRFNYLNSTIGGGFNANFQIGAANIASQTRLRQQIHNHNQAAIKAKLQQTLNG
jgi:hypothetical protein